MTWVSVQPELFHAWHGPSLLVVNTRGDCGDDQSLSGLYFRETRYLRTLALELNGERPWLCEAAVTGCDTLHFTYVHPELTEFGGGGSGQSGDEVTTDDHGIPHRSLDVRVRHRLRLDGLDLDLDLANRSRREVRLELAWVLDADYADLQEAHDGSRKQRAAVSVEPGDARESDACDACVVRFAYLHPDLRYRTRVATTGAGVWRVERGNGVHRDVAHGDDAHGDDARGDDARGDDAHRAGGSSAVVRLATTVHLAPGAAIRLGLVVTPVDYRDPIPGEIAAARERRWRTWRDGMTRITAPGDTALEDVIAHNVRDVASLPLLDGAADEWLAPQAGVPLYPALFGRDAITAGWQAAMLDRGEMLDATLTALGRRQTDRVDDWHDEEPGRIPFQLRQGPLARLDLNPFAASYADFASPLMFVVSLAHLYAWTGERECLARHWDTARRILDWARTYGDRDGDGYLEYETRSSAGPKNQGWKDSGLAVLYDDGAPVPVPIATCELQGYWFAAQQLMAVLSWVMGARGDARAHRAAAMELKARFNRDWWMPDERSFALAMDPGKRLVRSVTSNVGHCVASGIVSDEHLPATVGRLLAPDMFSGWGVRTLSTRHAAYDPLSYHRGSVWAVEQATIVFGLRRFGFDVRAQELAGAMFDLARLYPGSRIPECVGGYARGEHPTPGAYPRANAPQLWNATAFPLLLHALLGLQPVAPLHLLVVDPVLPTWLPEVVLHDLRLGGATATVRFWRDDAGSSHAELLRRRGTLRLVRQPPPESLSAGVADRFGALVESLFHQGTSRSSAGGPPA